jgi:hypothetical protein
MNIEGILTQLSQERPVFHSEADFQHALAWEIHRCHPFAKVRLQVNLGAEKRAAVDILVTNDEEVFGIELKYKTKWLFDAKHKDESFHILNHEHKIMGGTTS